MSIHINAARGAVAEDILLPGDPLRAKFIAEHFLTDAVCYNEVRGMLGYTGYYEGKRVSVQGTGMGVPSIGIYVHELMEQFGVKRAIRVGTCGALVEGLNIRDIVIASAAHTDSNMNHDRFGSISFAPAADFTLLRSAYEAAVQAGARVRVGTVFTSDKFYDDRGDEKTGLLSRYGALAVDMETAELYTLGAKFGAAALTILTVSDSLVTHEAVGPEERQSSFREMVRIALSIL